VQWLKALLGVAVVALLVIAYVVLHGSHHRGALGDLALDVIPALIVLVLAGIVGWYVLERRGLGKGMGLPQDESGVAVGLASVADEIVDRVAELPVYTEPRATTAPEVRRFWTSHRKVEWSEVIGTALSLDVVVVYYDTWIDENREELLSIFGRGGTIRLYLTDPRDERALEATADRFPEHSVDDLKSKIQGTAQRLDELRRESDRYQARLEVRLYPGVLNYAAIRADGDWVLTSFYEHKRERRIDAPAVLLDIAQSPELRRFWDKELRFLFERSVPAPAGFVAAETVADEGRAESPIPSSQGGSIAP
jgi:hypothetical protein